MRRGGLIEDAGRCTTPQSMQRIGEDVG